MSIREAVSATELDRHLRAVAAEVRLSGTPEEARAFDYIQGELERLGYAVQRFSSEALIGYPLHASLRVQGDDAYDIPANGYSLSPGTGPEGVTGKLVYVGAGMPADFAGLDVRGKIDRRCIAARIEIANRRARPRRHLPAQIDRRGARHAARQHRTDPRSLPGQAARDAVGRPLVAGVLTGRVSGRFAAVPVQMTTPFHRPRPEAPYLECSCRPLSPAASSS